MEKNVIVVASVLGIQSPSGLQLIHGNRTVTDLKHVAKIKEAMKRGEIVPPIIIDKLTKLIIGSWLPVNCGESYILSYLEFEFENPLLSAIRYNSNSKKWSTADYVKAYIVDGRESYDILRKFCQSHEHFRGGRSGFQYKAAAQLITGQACGDAIQRGTLQITEEQAKVADIAYNQLAQMAAAIGKERGGLTLLKRDIVLAWLGVRDLILSNMTIDAFTNLMKKHFVCQFQIRRFCTRVCIWMFTTNPRKRNSLRNGC